MQGRAALHILTASARNAILFEILRLHQLLALILLQAYGLLHVLTVSYLEVLLVSQGRRHIGALFPLVEGV